MDHDPRAPDVRPVAPPPSAPAVPRIVRPYVLTQGRTRGPDATYALEAQVRSLVPPSRLDRAATPEARRIVERCQTATSVAEVAVFLALPLGVTRVLVGDLVSVGLVAVETGSTGAGADVVLLERLLDGIRAL
ncbi:MAG: hypothetical protein AMXMBFR46_06860 [Acidimicrobiia bacterium]